MASDNEASCINDPNFAAICSFLEKFGASCGIISPDFLELQEMLENTQEVSPGLIDLHVKLLRKVRRSVSADRWERVLIKLCHTYCSQDAWELERFGYKKARLTSKLRILKILLEIQFDLNPKFKAEVNRLTANELRTEPIGRDKHGHSYWYQIDEHCQLRIYREDPDEETWLLVAQDREGLVRLISQLASNDPNLGDLTLNEDSNSLEIEKPIIDTGQTSSSASNCEPEADESSGGNEDSKDILTDSQIEPLTDENITEVDKKSEIQENKIKMTLSTGHILTQCEPNTKNMQEESTKTSSETPTKAGFSISQSSLQYESQGVDLSNKRKKSINELAANLRIKTHDRLYKNPVQEQEMDLSVKKPRLDPKHFSSLSEPPFEPMSLETALRMTTDFPESEEELADEEDDFYDSDEIELPSHMKQPRLDRPKLLGNAKKKPYSDEEDDYGEEIEEPVMIIHGEGSGRDCENENIYKYTNKNCEFSEVVEEPVMFIYGEGFGYECETGNTGKEEENTTPDKKSDSVSAKNSVVDCNSAEIKYDIIDKNSCESTSKQSECVPKCLKIGKVIVDVKSADRVPSTDIISSKKNSRWDIGKPADGIQCLKSEDVNNTTKNESKTDIKSVSSKTNKLIESNIFFLPNSSAESETNNDTTPVTSDKIDEVINSPTENLKTVCTKKQPMFFFGPGCFQFKTPIAPYTPDVKGLNVKSAELVIKFDNSKDHDNENVHLEIENVPACVPKSDILMKNEEINDLLVNKNVSSTPKTQSSNYVELSKNIDIHNENMLLNKKTSNNSNDNSFKSQDSNTEIKSEVKSCSISDSNINVSIINLNQETNMEISSDKKSHILINTTEKQLEECAEQKSSSSENKDSLKYNHEELETFSEKEIEGEKHKNIKCDDILIKSSHQFTTKKDHTKFCCEENPIKEPEDVNVNEISTNVSVSNINTEETLEIEKNTESELSVVGVANIKDCGDIKEFSSIMNKSKELESSKILFTNTDSQEDKTFTSKQVPKQLETMDKQIDNGSKIDDNQSGTLTKKSTSIGSKSNEADEYLQSKTEITIKEISSISVNENEQIINTHTAALVSSKLEESVEKVNIYEKQSVSLNQEASVISQNNLSDTNIEECIVQKKNISNIINENKLDQIKLVDTETKIEEEIVVHVCEKNMLSEVKLTDETKSEKKTVIDICEVKKAEGNTSTKNIPFPTEVENKSTVEKCVEATKNISIISEKEEQREIKIKKDETSMIPEKHPSIKFENTAVHALDTKDSIETSKIFHKEKSNFFTVSTILSNSDKSYESSNIQSINHSFTNSEENVMDSLKTEITDDSNIVKSEINLIQKSCSPIFKEIQISHTKANVDTEHVDSETLLIENKESEINLFSDSFIETKSNTETVNTEKKKILEVNLLNTITETENNLELNKLTINDKKQSLEKITQKLLPNIEENVMKSIAINEKQNFEINAENTYSESMENTNETTKKLEQNIVDKCSVKKEINETNVSTVTDILITEKQQECFNTTENKIKLNKLSFNVENKIIQEESQTKIDSNLSDEKEHTKESIEDNKIVDMSAEKHEVEKSTNISENTNILSNEIGKRETERNALLNHITGKQKQNSNLLEEKPSIVNVNEKDETIKEDNLGQNIIECKSTKVHIDNTQLKTTKKEIQNIILKPSMKNDIDTQSNSDSIHTDLNITETVKKRKGSEIIENLKSDTRKESLSITSESKDIDKNIHTSLQESECNDNFSSDDDVMDSCAFEDDEYNNDETPMKYPVIKNIKSYELKKSEDLLKDVTSAGDQLQNMGSKIILKNVQEIIADKNKTEKITLNDKKIEEIILDDKKTDEMKSEVTVSNIEVVTKDVLRPSNKLVQNKLDIEDLTKSSDIKIEDTKPPVLICVDITKLQDKLSSKPESKLVTELKQQSDISSPRSLESIGVDNEESSDVIDVPETDPLACTEEEILLSEKTENKPVKPQSLSLATFKLDDTDETDTSNLIPEPIARALRNRKISVEEANMSTRKKGRDNVQIDGGVGDKKRKGRGRLTKNVKDCAKRDVSSSEEDKNEISSNHENSSQLCSLPQRGTGKARRGRMRGRGRGAHISRVTNDSPVLSSDPQSETSRTDVTNSPVANKMSTSRKKKRVLGLDIDPSAIIEIESKTDNEESSRRGSIRQSRRIAQLKIREEAERRKIEELTLMEIKEKKKKKGKKDDDKDYKVENKKKKHKEYEEEEESEDEVIEISSKKHKHKKKHKHQDLKKLFNVTNPWQSSSGSSTSNEEEEEEEVEEEPSDNEAILKSDHEFSPESDLESNVETQPLRRARTVKKESDTDEPTDEHACQKCGKADHPEWILLCDKCDCGWHCSCLRPALLVIPEGDWFCPPCQHISLIEALKVQLVEYDKRMNRREMEVRRKQRLAYVGISLDNVLPSKEHEGKEEENKNTTQKTDSDDESSESDSNSESDSSSGNESEPIYQLRERRQAHSYRFNDYDELINSAIQDELEAVKGAGNQGRGKDIATIVNAEKEEAKTQALLDQQKLVQDPKQEFEETPPVVPVYETKIEHEVEVSEEYSDEEPRVVPKLVGRRKHRKLNSLDISSEDDPDDDEDFKGTSASEEEDLDDIGSEDSEEIEMGKKGRGRYGPTRRSTRTRTMRYDKDFINDDSEDDTPRRKKSRSIWDESESEQSDKSWGKKKRDKKRQSLISRSTKIPRKRKRRDDYDPEIKSRIKKPKIKYGGLNDSEDEELLTRRTRGKKINYIDALGSDTDEDKRKTKPLESEDEYVANEEDEDQDETIGAMDCEEKYSDSDSVQNKPAPVIMKKVIKIIAPSKTKGRGKAGIPRPQNLKSDPPELSVTTESEPKEESFEDMEDEDYPSIPADIPVIAANPEDLNEEEVGTMMMENEEYAKKQLELMAIQLAKEKKKKEKEAKKLTDVPVEPKKRGRKKKSEIEAALAASQEHAALPVSVNPVLVSIPPSNELEPNNKLVQLSPGAPVLDLPATVPTVVSELTTTPPKRRGRGKGKKTLAAEAAAVSPTGPIITTNASQESVIVPTSQVSDIVKSVSATTVMPPSTPFQNEPNPSQNLNILGGKLGIATPPQPFSQNQPAPSVITRMLQSQPMSAQTFTTGANSINQKYFPPGSPSGQFSSVGGRGRVPSPYRQSPPAMAIYPGVRPVTPNSPHRLRSPGPPNMQMFHSTHHSLDPSPSGGGPINIVSASRDRNSPAIVPPTVSSPLPSKEVLTTPPPPPYSRAAITVNRFSPNENSPGPSLPPPIRHHIFAQSSPPPRPPPAGNFSPYHPPPPPNYHYGAYPPAPSLAAADDALPPTDYQGSPYSEHYNPIDGTVHSSEGSNSKPFDEEGSGEFGGLVSYFSSQREDDLDT